MHILIIARTFNTKCKSHAHVKLNIIPGKNSLQMGSPVVLEMENLDSPWKVVMST